MAVKIDIENPRITFARIKIEVDGQEILAKAISYGDGVEFGNIEGNARMSLGTTDGMYAADEGTLEVYADEYAEIQDAFAADFFGKTFDIAVTYEVEGSSKLKKDELIGCRWTKRAVSDQSGADGLTRTLSYKPSYIKMNGHNPIKDMPQGAR